MLSELINTTITGGTFIDYSSHVDSSHVYGATIGTSSIEQKL